MKVFVVMILVVLTLGANQDFTPNISWYNDLQKATDAAKQQVGLLDIHD
jgi:hypothetical protein